LTFPNFPNPTNGGKKKGSSRHSQSEKGGHLSPAEFFQMSRLRASALANKLNTSATYGGSKDLVTTVTGQAGQPTGQPLKRSSEGKEEEKVDTVDTVVDELAKAVQDVKLEKKEEEKGKHEEGKAEVADHGDLIGRSPVPVYSNNRHVQHPYKQGTTKYPSPQAVPIPGYCTQKAPDGSPMTPADYMQSQRMRASPGQYPYGMAQSNGYVAYSQGTVDEPHQITPPNGYSMDQQGMYSPDSGYANQDSPNMHYTNTPPAWIINQDNTGHMPPPGSCSPMSGMSPDDGQGNNYGMVMSPFEDTAINADQSIDRSIDPSITEELNRFFQQSQNQNQGQGNGANKSLEELPEALSDFILKYSRRYSTSSGTVSTVSTRDGMASGTSSGCVSGEPSPMSTGGRRPSDSSLSGVSGDESGVEDDMASISTRSMNGPDSCQSVFLDSPQSINIGSVPSGTASPAAPMPSEVTKMEEKPICAKYRPLRPKQAQQPSTAQAGTAQSGPAQPGPAQAQAQPPTGQPVGKARQHLREMIAQHEFDAAWAWAMRCCQACPGSLLFRDADGDR